ncbi:hypothetical protein JCM15519_16200 [Fundidesulfovibrio butyratiphilus]
MTNLPNLTQILSMLTLRNATILLIFLGAAVIGYASYLTFKKMKLAQTDQIRHTTVYDVISTSLELVYSIFQNVYRKVRALPLSITGTHPYIFDRECKIHLSLYSKSKIWLFGGMSVLVSFYVFTSMYGSLKEFYNIQNNYIATIVSTIASLIVYSCDKAILSYPSVTYDIRELIAKERSLSRSLFTFKGLYYYARYIILRVYHYFQQSIFMTMRIILALTISLFLIIPSYVTSNKEVVERNKKQQQAVKDEKQQEQRSTRASLISSYINARDDYNRKYNVYYENAALAYLCEQAKAPVLKLRKYESYRTTFHVSQMGEAKIKNHDPRLGKADPVWVEPKTPTISITRKPYRRTTLAEIDSNIAEYTNNAQDAWLKTQEAFDKYNPLAAEIEKQKLQHLVASPALLSQAANPLNTSSAAQSNGDTSSPSGKNIIKETKQNFGQAMQDTKEYLMSLYNDVRGNNFSVSFMFEMLINLPFFMILMLFETLPVVAKLLFPPSGFERMVALQDLDHTLKYTYFHDQAALDTIRNKHTNLFKNTQYDDFSSELRSLDTVQKKKDSELRVAVENFKNSFIDYMTELTIYPVLAAILVFLLILLLAFSAAYSIGFFPGSGQRLALTLPPIQA